MNVRIKRNGKFIVVDVSREECKNFECFSPHRYQHFGQTIDGKSNNYTDKNYTCSHRNYNGCPDKPKKVP